MNTSLRWLLVVIGAALWVGASFGVYHLRDDAMRLAEADITRDGYHQSGDLLKAYDAHLAETRNERALFYVGEFAGFALAVFSGRLSKRRTDA